MSIFLEYACKVKLYLVHFGGEGPLEEEASWLRALAGGCIELYSRCAVFPFKILSHTRLPHERLFTTTATNALHLKILIIILNIPHEARPSNLSVVSQHLYSWNPLSLLLLLK